MGKKKNAVSVYKEISGPREREKAARGRGQGVGLEMTIGMTRRDKGQGREGHHGVQVFERSNLRHLLKKPGVAEAMFLAKAKRPCCRCAGKLWEERGCALNRELKSEISR